MYKDRLSVLLVAEGTYPYYFGGVSTWCHNLLTSMPDIDFTLFSIIDNPSAVPLYALPESVVDFRTVPIWGVRTLRENQRKLSPIEFWHRWRSTTNHTIEDHFLSLFHPFLQVLFADTCQPGYMASLIHDIYHFLLTHDFDIAFRSQAVWDCFTKVVQDCYPRLAAQHGYPNERYDLSEMTNCMQWLYRWLFPIASPIPRTDVVHTAMAGLCTLVAIAAKLEYGTPFLMTEHGIYLREKYFAEAENTGDLFQKIFNLQFSRRMTEMTYALADQISPCCDYNQRWELRNGVCPDKLRTIYYGVDHTKFTPTGKPFGVPPIVVWVGRIDPLKDVLTLIRTAAIVHESRPDIQFNLYGSAPPGREKYYQKCIDLRKELELEDTVIFAGYRSDPVTAYNEGDIVVLTSTSEAFPFAILEAMLCEKPIVATAVGGIPEQIEGCGYAVEPRNPDALAEAILKLMNDPSLSLELGRVARQKAIDNYNLEAQSSLYKKAYERLAEQWVSKIIASCIDIASGSPVFSMTESIDQIESTAFSAPVYRDDEFIPETAQGLRTNLVVLTDSSETSGIPIYQGYSGLYDTQKHKPGGSSSSTKLYLQRAPISSLIPTLAVDITQRDPLPIDALEITAILETHGITDAVSQNRYGVSDTFELGEAVLSCIRSTGIITKPIKPHVDKKRKITELLMDFSQGPMVLIPVFVTLFIIMVFNIYGGWNQRQVLIMSASFTVGMLLANVGIQSLCRRTSFYLSNKKPYIARKFLLSGIVISGTVIVGIACLIALVACYTGMTSIGEAYIIFASLSGISILWLLTGAFSVIRKMFWVGLSILSGLTVGFIVDQAIAPYSNAHLLLGTAAGYVVTIILLSVTLSLGFVHRGEAKPSTSQRKARFPTFFYVITESASSSLYSAIYILFILLPHVLIWLGAIDNGIIGMSMVASMEAALTLSMIPLILSGGIIEYTLKTYWLQAATLRENTPGEDIAKFHAALIHLYYKNLGIYFIVYPLISLIEYIFIREVIFLQLMPNGLFLSDIDQVLFIFASGLVSYLFLGVGLYNCLFCITLNQMRIPIWAVILGSVIMVLVGIPLIATASSFGIFAFLLGTLTFFSVSHRMIIPFLKRSDYYFLWAT